MGESPIIFSFFSGAGFLDLGFESSGYKIALVNDSFSPFLDAHRYSRVHLQLPQAEYGYDNCSVEQYLEISSRLQAFVRQ